MQHPAIAATGATVASSVRSFAAVPASSAAAGATDASVGSSAASSAAIDGPSVFAGRMQDLDAVFSKLPCDVATVQTSLRNYLQRWGLRRAWNDPFPRRPMVFVSFLEDDLASTAFWLPVCLAGLVGSQSEAQQILTYQVCNMSAIELDDIRNADVTDATNALVIIGHGNQQFNGLASGGGRLFNFATISRIVQHFNPGIVVLITCEGAAYTDRTLMHSLLAHMPHLHVYGCIEKLHSQTVLAGPMNVFITLLYGYLARSGGMSLHLLVEEVLADAKCNGLVTNAKNTHGASLSEYQALLAVAASCFISNEKQRDSLVLSIATIRPGGVEMIDTKPESLLPVCKVLQEMMKRGDKGLVRPVQELDSKRWNLTPCIKLDMQHITPRPHRWSFFKDAAIVSFTQHPIEQGIDTICRASKCEHIDDETGSAPPAGGNANGSAPMEFARKDKA